MRTQIWCAFFSISLSKLKICAHKYAHTNICMSPARRLNQAMNSRTLISAAYTAAGMSPARRLIEL
jgi:hypothetical protein